ncbi:WhiB family transcriptional regulator [Streptomyces sp. NPDC059224]|uniref:WhiB family transcriptional regulator n=1 Tax=Streptomyces sp. NPDC059224 TaxID=3346775 RepID=UPI00367F282F
MPSLATLTATTTGLPCREEPAPFFSTDPNERHYAARQCHRCPLLLACQQHALATREQHGVWGGVDFEARAMGCGTERGYQVHLRRKQEVCPRCQAVHDEAVEANRRRLLELAHREGGTVRGYAMHRKLGERPCDGCRSAQGRQSAKRRERLRAEAARPCAPVVALEPAEPLRGPHAGAHALAIAS